MLADNPPTNIFFVLVTIWKRREDKRLSPCESILVQTSKKDNKERAGGHSEAKKKRGGGFRKESSCCPPLGVCRGGTVWDWLRVKCAKGPANTYPARLVFSSITSRFNTFFLVVHLSCERYCCEKNILLYKNWDGHIFFYQRKAIKMHQWSSEVV